MTTQLYENDFKKARALDDENVITDQTLELIEHISRIRPTLAREVAELKHEIQLTKNLPEWLTLGEIDTEYIRHLIHTDRFRAARTLRELAQAGFPRSKMYDAAAAVETLWSAMKTPRRWILWQKLGRYDADRVYQFICHAARHILKLVDTQDIPAARDHKEELKRLIENGFDKESDRYKIVKKDSNRLKRRVSFTSSNYLKAAIQSRRLKLIPSRGFQWSPNVSAATDREVMDSASMGSMISFHWPASQTIRTLVCDHLVKHPEHNMQAISIRASILFDHVFQILDELPAGHIDPVELRADALTAWTTGSVELIRQKYQHTLERVEQLQRLSRDSSNLGTSIEARKEDLAAARRLAAHARRLTAAKSEILKDADPAERLQSIKVSLCNLFQRVHGELPDNVKKMAAHELTLRACDARWWKRRITKTRLQNRENIAREFFMFSKKRSSTKFVSSAAINEVQKADEVMFESLKNMYLKSEDGKVFSIFDLLMRSPAAPRHQMIETFKRIRGTSDYCHELGLIPIFAVVTLESEWHRESRGHANPNWNGSTPSECQKELGKRWKKVLDRCRKTDIELIGFRTTEGHGDATPHWNVIGHVFPEQVEAFKEIMLDEFYHKHDPEPDTSTELRRARMQRIRVRFKDVEQGNDPTMGLAVLRYIAKYIFKHFFKLNNGRSGKADFDQIEDADIDEVPVREDHQIWNAIHSIPKFKFFGLKPIELYREMRRIGGGNEDTLQMLLDDGTMDSWHPEFQKAHQAACGYQIEDSGFFGKKIKLNEADDEGSKIDFGKYLSIVEPLEIKLVDEDFERDTRTVSELRSAADFADLLGVSADSFGTGRYGNSKPRRRSHFLIVDEQGEHQIACQRRIDFVQCDEQGKEIEPTVIHDDVVGLDYESMSDADSVDMIGGFYLPDFSIDGLVQILKSDKDRASAKLFNSNPRGKPAALESEFDQAAWEKMLFELAKSTPRPPDSDQRAHQSIIFRKGYQLPCLLLRH